MRPLADLLEEHLAADCPTEIENGREYGSIDPVMVDEDICGWVRSHASGVEFADAARSGLEQVRLKIGESWSALPVEATPYFARLLRLADTAVQGCDDVPSPAPPLAKAPSSYGVLNRLSVPRISTVEPTGELERSASTTWIELTTAQVSRTKLGITVL